MCDEKTRKRVSQPSVQIELAVVTEAGYPFACTSVDSMHVRTYRVEQAFIIFSVSPIRHPAVIIHIEVPGAVAQYSIQRLVSPSLLASRGVDSKESQLRGCTI